MIASTDTFFGSVKHQYREYFSSGFFKKTSGDGMFVYEIINPDYSSTALISTVDVKDYSEGYILKHEDTLSTKEQKMMNLLLQRKAMIKPVLLAHQANKSVDKILNKVKKKKPLFSFTFEETNEIHTVWQISDGIQIEKLQIIYKNQIPITYIADGHHRCSTSSLLHEGTTSGNLNMNFSHVLCAFFSFDNLQIHDYNRVIDGLGHMSATQFMAHISKYAEISPRKKAFKPKKKHQMAMCINKEWYKLEWKKSVVQRNKKKGIVLDADLLNDKILNKILGIKDVRSDSRISYVEGILGIDGMEEACLKNEHNIGFALFPVKMKEFISLANQGRVLPPKSTWFEPRMKNGLISQEF